MYLPGHSPTSFLAHQKHNCSSIQLRHAASSRVKCVNATIDSPVEKQTSSCSDLQSISQQVLWRHGTSRLRDVGHPITPADQGRQIRARLPRPNLHLCVATCGSILRRSSSKSPVSQTNHTPLVLLFSVSSATIDVASLGKRGILNLSLENWFMG